MANGSGWVPFKEDAFAAYTHALLWYIEQDPKHAVKAIELLDGACREHTRSGDPPDDLFLLLAPLFS